MSGSLAFKCYLKTNGQEAEIRRFTVDHDVVGNFTYLKEKIRSIYPQLLRENFNLMYTDEENDIITISSDDELVAALMYAKRKENEPFRLIVKLVEGAKQPAATTSTGEANYGNCQGDIHIGVTCDGCQGAVRGFRYKCAQCPDFDLCGKCETSGLHPGHTLVRVTGAMPSFFPALRNLLHGGGAHDMPHWRRRGHGCRSSPHHGRWNAWCPSGISVEVDPPTCAAEEAKKTEANKPEGCPFKAKESGGKCPYKGNGEQPAGQCPFKSNMEQAKQAAQAFHATHGAEFVEQAKQAAQAAQAFHATHGTEILQNIGSTIASILEQFGIDTQVDVHGPETGGACPRAEKKEEASSAKAEEETKPKEEPKKEVIIPITVEKSQEEEAKQEAVPEKEVKETEPYAGLVDAVAAVRAAEAAEAAEAAQEAAAAAHQGSPARSPSRGSGDWTIVDHAEKPSAGTELGARPKSPAKPAPPAQEAPLHPDPLVAAALEKMLAMGFTNEGGWLSQLLEVKGGDIGKTLDVLHSQFQRHQ